VRSMAPWVRVASPARSAIGADACGPRFPCMASPSDTRPFSQRDPTISPPAEILGRFLLLVQTLAAIGGALLLGFGLTQHRPVVAVAGAIALALATGLHLTRARWGRRKVLDEIRANPFKPGRRPKGGDDTLL
jgi:hypothetical protein